MKITIKVKGKEYEVYGVRSFEPLAISKGVFIYFTQKLDGFWTQMVKGGVVVSARQCELGQEFTSQETKRALGWTLIPNTTK